VSRFRPFGPFLLPFKLHLATLYLVFLQGETDGDLRLFFLHALDVFSPVTNFISGFINTLRFI
jgi:hypothetical protein